jgi:uncharacterized membrane protein YfcA
MTVVAGVERSVMENTGLGGFAGSYAGARLQRRLPETSLRRLLGLIACLVAARYAQTAIQQPSSRTPAPALIR